MAGVAEIRQALADALSAADLGLTQVTPAPLTQPTPPCAWVIRRTVEQYTNGDGTTSDVEGATFLYTFGVRVVVGLSDDLASQVILDGFADPNSSTSIKKALEADSTLGGLVEDIYVQEATQDLLVQDRAASAVSQYLAVDFTVEVYAPGS